jgi:hypothetical protein
MVLSRGGLCVRDEVLDALDLHYPKVSKEKLVELGAAKRALEETKITAQDGCLNATTSTQGRCNVDSQGNHFHGLLQCRASTGGRIRPETPGGGGPRPQPRIGGSGLLR